MFKVCDRCAMIFIVLLMLIFCKINEAAPVSIDDRDAALSFEEHLSLTKKFQCRRPQLRAYKIKDSLPEDQRGIKDVITPFNTVVRRCDEGSGCCGNGNVCVPNPNDMTFGNVTVKLNNLLDGTSKLRTLEIEEPRSCMCMPKSNRSHFPVKPPNMRLFDP